MSYAARSILDTYSLALPVVFIIVLGHYSLIEVLARERKDRRREPRHRTDGRAPEWKSRRWRGGLTRSIRGLISSRAAQEILLEELQVEVGYHMQVRRVEVHVLVEECDHEQQRGHQTLAVRVCEVVCAPDEKSVLVALVSCLRDDARGKGPRRELNRRGNERFVFQCEPQSTPRAFFAAGFGGFLAALSDRSGDSPECSERWRSPDLESGATGSRPAVRADDARPSTRIPDAIDATPTSK